MENRHYSDSVGVDCSFVWNGVVIINWEDGINSEIPINEIVRSLISQLFINIPDKDGKIMIGFSDEDIMGCLEIIKENFDNEEDDNNKLGFSKTIPIDDSEIVCPRCKESFCECFNFEPFDYVSPIIYPIGGGKVNITMKDTWIDTSLLKIKETFECLPDEEGVPHNDVVVVEQHLNFTKWKEDNPNNVLSNLEGHLVIHHEFRNVNDGRDLPCRDGYYPTVYIKDKDQCIRLLTIDPWVSIVLPLTHNVAMAHAYVDLSGKTLSLVYISHINKYYFIHPLEVRKMMRIGFLSVVTRLTGGK